MDLNLSPDITESFRLFQRRVLDEYLKMVDKFGLTVMDATQSVHRQQVIVRRPVQDRVDLGLFRKRYVQ